MESPSRSRTLWSWRAFWFLALIAGVAAMFPLVRRVSETLRVDQARDELAQMQKMIGAYRERNKVWPIASSNSSLLLAFLGKLEPLPKQGKPQWYLAGTRLYFRPVDPEAQGAQVIDPWGRPYAYRFLPATPQAPSSYVLFSAGADGKYSAPATWGRGTNGMAPEDLDNICVFPPPASQPTPRK